MLHNVLLYGQHGILYIKVGVLDVGCLLHLPHSIIN